MEGVYLHKGFGELKGWMENIYSMKIRYNMLEDFILKYSWCKGPITINCTQPNN